MIGGHGHVKPRPDGAKARCGGPRICPECAKELAQSQGSTIGVDQAMRDQIKAYVEERDRILQSDDPKEWRKLFELAGEPVPVLLEVSINIARSGARSLPSAVQINAHKWLVENGKGHLSLFDGQKPPTVTFEAVTELPDGTVENLTAQPSAPGASLLAYRPTWAEETPRVILLSTLLGHIAMAAVRQDPFHQPSDLEEVLVDFDSACRVGSVVNGWQPAFDEFHGSWMREYTPDGLEDLLRERLIPHPQVQAWNVPRSGKEYPGGFAFTSRYDGPKPEDDFIDLDALTRNIVRTVFTEAMLDDTHEMVPKQPQGVVTDEGDD